MTDLEIILAMLARRKHIFSRHDTEKTITLYFESTWSDELGEPDKEGAYMEFNIAGELVAIGPHH